MGKQDIEAVIFDLDGVITDTAKFHYLAWKRLSEDINIKLDPSLNERLKGISRMDALEVILEAAEKERAFTEKEKLEFTEIKNRYYKEYLNELTTENILSGIMELIEEIKSEGITIGVASVSRNAWSILKALKLENVFDHVVDAEKITHSKPDPEIFLAATSKLHASPKNAIGLDDAIAGVKSINASGMFSVGIGSNLVEADYKVSSTKHLKWKEIKNHYLTNREKKEQIN